MIVPMRTARLSARDCVRVPVVPIYQKGYKKNCTTIVPFVPSSLSSLVSLLYCVL